MTERSPQETRAERCCSPEATRAAVALVLRPASLTTWTQRYAAMLGGRILCTSRQPFYDAARVLLAEGLASDTVLEARHDGSTFVAIRSTVGEAAKWTIEETERPSQIRRRTWRPFRDGVADFALEAAE